MIKSPNLQKLNYEELENQQTHRTKDIESVIKNFPTKKVLGSVNFPGEFSQTFKSF
jgi:hypothetical protein